MQQVRIVLAGGAPLLQAGIAAALAGDDRLKVIAQVPNVQEVGGFLTGDGCDVVVLNTEAPCVEAATLMARRRECDGGCLARVLVLTDQDSTEELLITLHLGVEGYAVRRSLWPEDIRSALFTLKRGLPWLCPLATRQLVAMAVTLAGGTPVGCTRPGLLSHREAEVLGLAAMGAGEEEIAQRLYLSRSTVKTYLRRIREKLQVTSRSEAVRLGYQRGLIPAPQPVGAA